MDLQTLVLNADYRPLSYSPLSLWGWRDALVALFSERVTLVATYDLEARSPSRSMPIPSVVALKNYISPVRHPAFTRYNIYLRDRFTCQYCSQYLPSGGLTFDHVMPRSRGGLTTWENVVAACSLSLVRRILVHDVSELPPAKLANRCLRSSRNRYQFELRVREVAQ